MIGRLGTGIVIAALLCGCATAKPTQPQPAPQPAPAGTDCKLKQSSNDVLSLKRLPANIRDALLKQAGGGMADRGEFFNATDVVIKPAPFNRFIRAGQTHGGWYAWYEHGGIAYWHQVVLFRIDPPGKVVVAASVIARNQSLCEATDALFDAKPQ